MAGVIQTPPLTVARQVSACALCRRKKTRCDGRLPACSACENVGKASECSNGNDVFARGRERSYVTALETQVERLRAERAQLLNPTSNSRSRGQSEPQSDASEQYLSPPRITHSEPDGRPMPGRKQQQRSQTDDRNDVDELVSDFGYLAINAAASGYQGFVREMSFARLLFSMAAMDPIPAVSETAQLLPSRPYAVNLIDECRRKLLQFTPIISESSIFRSLDRVYQHGGQTSTPRDRWNLRMLLALGCLCRSATKGDVQYQAAVAHAAAAIEYREAVIVPGSIASLQSLLLLALYSIMNPSHFNAWFVIGLAARVAVDMGLHTDLGADPESTKAQLDLRRQVFYCLYTLDRAVTLTLVRAVSFTDASVQVALPIPQYPFGDPLAQAYSGVPPHDPSHDIIRARQILSEHYQNAFLVTRKALHRRWQERIPMLNDVRTRVSAIIQSQSSPSPLLRIEMHYFSLLLLQPPGAEQQLGEYGEVLAFDYVVEYANAIWLLMDKRQAWDECCTSLDLERSLRVCCWLHNLLDTNYSPALNSSEPLAPATPPGTQIPSLATSNLAERRSNAALALQQLDHVIEELGTRFGFPRREQAVNGDGRTGSGLGILEVQQLPSPPTITKPMLDAHLDHVTVRAQSAATLQRLMTNNQ